MAKKKQFAGKQTKLAALPLTRALAEKNGEGGAWEELQTSAGTSPRQLLLSMERTGEDSLSPLAAAYLQILHELAILQADLGPGAPSAPTSPEPWSLAALPHPRNLKQALSQAREGLQDLHRLLSK